MRVDVPRQESFSFRRMGVSLWAYYYYKRAGGASSCSLRSL